MTRVVLTIVVPLLLPTALYLLWLVTAGRAKLARTGSPWHGLPWPWLAVAGVVLTALVLVAVSVGLGGSRQGTYVPPHVEDGRIVPGHIAPGTP
jgi:hypothetical protein